MQGLKSCGPRGRQKKRDRRKERKGGRETAREVEGEGGTEEEEESRRDSGSSSGKVFTRRGHLSWVLQGETGLFTSLSLYLKQDTKATRGRKQYVPVRGDSEKFKSSLKKPTGSGN